MDGGIAMDHKLELNNQCVGLIWVWCNGCECVSVDPCFFNLIYSWFAYFNGFGLIYGWFDDFNGFGLIYCIGWVELLNTQAGWADTHYPLTCAGMNVWCDNVVGWLYEATSMIIRGGWSDGEYVLLDWNS